MKHTVLTRSYPGVLQRSDSSSGTTRVKIYTPAELYSSARLREEARRVERDLIENAYRHGVERAEELCHQVFGRPHQPATAFK